MATVKHAISEHDVVVLREPVGAWPAATTGALSSVYDDTLLVEITGPGGKTLDTIKSPPHGSTSRTPEPEQSARNAPGRALASA